MKSLALENVHVRFGAVQALRGVSVHLEAGEALLLAGPNGAGKSTLMRVLLDLVRPNAGQVLVSGGLLGNKNVLKRQLGYLPEAVAFSENLSGHQVLKFFARARAVPRTRIDQVLERVGLQDASRRSVRSYSRGMRQRLGLAVAILADPQLLILDEPTGGLDQEGLSVLWSVIEEWRTKEGMVLIASHDIAMLERRVDRMTVLRAGQVVADDTPDNLRTVTDLPQRVTMTLNPQANGQITELVAAIERWGHCKFIHDTERLSAEVAPSALLELMNLRAQFPDAVTGLRIEEPQLDAIYERLLSTGSGAV